MRSEIRRLSVIITVLNLLAGVVLGNATKATSMISRITVCRNQVSSKRASQAKFVRAERIAGVECRLLADKGRWRANEIPKLKAYVRDHASPGLDLVTIPDLGCYLQVDGIWHGWTDRQWEDGMAHHPSDWMATNGGYMRISLDSRHWQSVLDGEPITLTPGRHAIRLAWAEHERKGPVRLVSEPVEIEILSPTVRTKHTPWGDGRRRQVRDLFHSYVTGDVLTAADREAGLKFNLRAFFDWFPKFTWSDIGVLLELAQSGRLLPGMPSLDISSHRGSHCREGMVALWLIEGLRRKQLSVVRKKQLAEEPRRACYGLPLNPICVRQNVKLSECEHSAEIHKMVLQAYRTWWDTVGSLPPGQAAVFYPLDLTELGWFGGGERWREVPLETYKKASSSGTVAQRVIRQWQWEQDGYQPGKVLQTIYYKLKDPDVNPPFTMDMLTVQKVVLHYYDGSGRRIRDSDIVPPSH